MNNIKVALYEGMGRGVQAITTMMVGEIIVACELLVLSETDTPIANQTELQHYTFKYNDTQDCLVLGHGEIFNHDDQPNVKYDLMDFTQGGQTRKMMVFTALRTIHAGEQLLIDYGADIKVDVQSYINSKSMME